MDKYSHYMSSLYDFLWSEWGHYANLSTLLTSLICYLVYNSLARLRLSIDRNLSIECDIGVVFIRGVAEVRSLNSALAFSIIGRLNA